MNTKNYACKTCAYWKPELKSNPKLIRRRLKAKLGNAYEIDVWVEFDGGVFGVFVRRIDGFAVRVERQITGKTMLRVWPQQNWQSNGLTTEYAIRNFNRKMMREIGQIERVIWVIENLWAKPKKCS